MQDLWRLSATDLAALIKSRKVSAKEAATAALARLDAVNPKLNAVIDHRPADVLAEAAAVDARIAQGADPGMLAGVPVTVKVNIDQAGFATTNGLKIQKDAIAKDNSPVIDNLRKAGAVILGRTNCERRYYQTALFAPIRARDRTGLVVEFEDRDFLDVGVAPRALETTVTDVAPTPQPTNEPPRRGLVPESAPRQDRPSR